MRPLSLPAVRALAFAAIACCAVAIAIAIGGGLSVQLGPVAVRSHNPLRPFVLAVVCLGLALSRGTAALSSALAWHWEVLQRYARTAAAMLALQHDRGRIPLGRVRGRRLRFLLLPESGGAHRARNGARLRTARRRPELAGQLLVVRARGAHAVRPAGAGPRADLPGRLSADHGCRARHGRALRRCLRSLR